MDAMKLPKKYQNTYTKATYEGVTYHVGDTVYIGSAKAEILKVAADSCLVQQEGYSQPFSYQWDEVSHQAPIKSKPTQKMSTPGKHTTKQGGTNQPSPVIVQQTEPVAVDCSAQEQRIKELEAELIQCNDRKNRYVEAGRDRYTEEIDKLKNQITALSQELQSVRLTGGVNRLPLDLPIGTPGTQVPESQTKPSVRSNVEQKWLDKDTATPGTYYKDAYGNGWVFQPKTRNNTAPPKFVYVVSIYKSKDDPNYISYTYSYNLDTHVTKKIAELREQGIEVPTSNSGRVIFAERIPLTKNPAIAEKIKAENERIKKLKESRRIDTTKIGAKVPRNILEREWKDGRIMGILIPTIYTPSVVKKVVDEYGNIKKVREELPPKKRLPGKEYEDGKNDEYHAQEPFWKGKDSIIDESIKNRYKVDLTPSEEYYHTLAHYINYSGGVVQQVDGVTGIAMGSKAFFAYTDDLISAGKITPKQAASVDIKEVIEREPGRRVNMYLGVGEKADRNAILKEIQDGKMVYALSSWATSRMDDSYDYHTADTLNWKTDVGTGYGSIKEALEGKAGYREYARLKRIQINKKMIDVVEVVDYNTYWVAIYKDDLIAIQGNTNDVPYNGSNEYKEIDAQGNMLTQIAPYVSTKFLRTQLAKQNGEPSPTVTPDVSPTPPAPPQPEQKDVSVLTKYAEPDFKNWVKNLTLIIKQQNHSSVLSTDWFIDDVDILMPYKNVAFNGVDVFRVYPNSDVGGNGSRSYCKAVLYVNDKEMYIIEIPYDEKCWSAIAKRVYRYLYDKYSISSQPEPSVTVPQSDVQMIPMERIRVDKDTFQPRNDFSESRVLDIVNNYDEFKLQPLKLWYNPNDDYYYVLGGHHRYEALKRLRKQYAPAKVYMGSKDEAIAIAYTDNARDARSQSELENSKYLRLLRARNKTKKEVLTECEALYDKSCRTVYLLSLIDEGAVILDDLRMFSRASDDYKDLEQMAKWIGTVIEQYPELHSSHQNELYKYLKANYKTQGKKITSGSEFMQTVEQVIVARFPFGQNITENVPLNLENYLGRNAGQQMFDAAVAEAEKELKEARQALINKTSEIAQKQHLYSEQVKQDVLKKYNDAVIIAQRKLLELRNRAGDINPDDQAALFGLGEDICIEGETVTVAPCAMGYYTLSDAFNVQLHSVPLRRTKSLFGKLNKRFTMLVWGLAGQGKSSFVMMLADDLAHDSKTLLLLREEKVKSGRVGERAARMGVHNDNIILNDQLSIYELRALLAANKEIEYVVVDSIQKWQVEEKEIDSLIDDYPAVSFVFVSQSNKDGGEYRGFPALANTVDTVVNVTDGVARTTKHRDYEMNKTLPIFKQNVKPEPEKPKSKLPVMYQGLRIN